MTPHAPRISEISAEDHLRAMSIARVFADKRRVGRRLSRPGEWGDAPMWSIAEPGRKALIWASILPIMIAITVALDIGAERLLEPRYPYTPEWSSQAETLIALPGAFVGALTLLGLFIVPPHLARAVGAWRRAHSLAGDGAFAGWTVDAATWRRFQERLEREPRGAKGACTRSALALRKLSASSEGIAIRVGREAVLVGNRVFGLPGDLREISWLEADPDVNAEMLAFITLFEGSSRSLGAYAVEEIGLLLPVPARAADAARKVIDHFTPDVLAAFDARRRRRARIGCGLYLALCVVSMAALASAAIFDTYTIGWYGLILFALLLIPVVYVLIHAVIGMIAGFGRLFKVVGPIAPPSPRPSGARVRPPVRRHGRR
jgi:hypothetical protein